MRTILIEGTELSGKTTLARSLSDRLLEEGRTVYVNEGPINPYPMLVRASLRIADGVKSPSIKEFFYSLSLAFDNHPRDINGFSELEYFIQERGFPSVVAFSMVFNKFGINRYMGRLLIPAYTHFDYNVLVTTSEEERYKRAMQRERKTWLDNLVIFSPDTTAKLENEIKRLLSRENNYIEVDTTKMSIDDETKEVLGRLK